MAKLVTYKIPTVETKGKRKGKHAGYEERQGRVIWAKLGETSHKLVLQSPKDDPQGDAEALVHFPTGAKICDLNSRRLAMYVGAGFKPACRTVAMAALGEIVSHCGIERIESQFAIPAVINE